MVLVLPLVFFTVSFTQSYLGRKIDSLALSNEIQHNHKIISSLKNIIAASDKQYSLQTHLHI